MNAVFRYFEIIHRVNFYSYLSRPFNLNMANQNNSDLLVYFSRLVRIKKMRLKRENLILRELKKLPRLQRIIKIFSKIEEARSLYSFCPQNNSLRISM